MGYIAISWIKNRENVKGNCLSVFSSSRSRKQHLFFLCFSFFSLRLLSQGCQRPLPLLGLSVTSSSSSSSIYLSVHDRRLVLLVMCRARMNSRCMKTTTTREDARQKLKCSYLILWRCMCFSMVCRRQTVDVVRRVLILFSLEDDGLISWRLVVIVVVLHQQLQFFTVMGGNPRKRWDKKQQKIRKKMGKQGIEPKRMMHLIWTSKRCCTTRWENF